MKPRSRAMLLTAARAPLALVERDVPEPGANEVRVRVEACGVCRTDCGGCRPTPRAFLVGRNAAESGSEAAADLSLKLPAALVDQRAGGPPEEPSPRSRWRSDTAERVECALEKTPRFHTVVAR